MIECQIICACLQRKDFSLFSLNGIDENFFKLYKKEFRFIAEHYNSYGNVPDMATFLNKFPEFQIVEVAESNTYLVDELFDQHLFNTAVPILKEVAGKFKNLDSKSAVAYLQSQLPALTKKVSLQAHDITDVAERYERYTEICENRHNAFIPTGLKELDELVGGLDTKEENAIITASTGVGKSWIALYFGLNAAKDGRRVGYYSGEMSLDQVGWRVDTMYSHISNFALTKGNSAVSEKYKQHLDEFRKGLKGKFYCVTPQDFGGYPTVAQLGSFIEKYQLDLMIIDQLSLLQDSVQGLQRYDSYTRLSKEIKSLQVMKKIPIVTVVQLNRGANSKDVTTLGTEHIAGSNRIAEDATLILSVRRVDKNLEIKVVKSRSSGSGTVLLYNWDFDKFEYTLNSVEPEMNTSLAEFVKPVDEVESIRHRRKENSGSGGEIVF